jgi:hypothetical protein
LWLEFVGSVREAHRARGLGVKCGYVESGIQGGALGVGFVGDLRVGQMARGRMVISCMCPSAALLAAGG